MTEPWAAEVTITPELAGKLIGSQFPGLADATIEPFGEGWDNCAFLVGGETVFRFPRRTIAAQLIETEIAVLPAIAARLPVAISAPSFAGRPSDAYPWRFAGYPVLPGTPLSKVSSRANSKDTSQLAAQLGAFLRELHTIDASPLVALGLPSDTIGRLDHARRMPLLRERFGELQSAELIGDASASIEFLESIAPDGPREDRLTIVHGDLYAAHILVDGDSATGIIDWGDAHFGDPAIDVAIAFEVFPASARVAFRAAYGAIDDETWDLARYRAIYHSALVAHYGHRIGDADLLAASLRGLELASY